MIVNAVRISTSLQALRHYEVSRISKNTAISLLPILMVDYLHDNCHLCMLAEHRTPIAFRDET